MLPAQLPCGLNSLQSELVAAESVVFLHTVPSASQGHLSLQVCEVSAVQLGVGDQHAPSEGSTSTVSLVVMIRCSGQGCFVKLIFSVNRRRAGCGYQQCVWSSGDPKPTLLSMVTLRAGTASSSTETSDPTSSKSSASSSASAIKTESSSGPACSE